MMASHTFAYTLYTFFGSSCSARVRIAAHHKKIPLTYKFIRLHKGDQHLPSYISTINPSASVPALVVHNINSDPEVDSPVAIITQSIAIIEYLEEVHPSPIKLLPSLEEPLLRAKVRELANIIACDIQPLTNMRVFKHIASLVSPGDPNSWHEDDWQRHFMTLGLSAYEKLVAECAGKFSVGDQLTMADVCLIPAIDRAERYEVDMTKFPIVRKINNEIRQTEAYKKGGLRSQPDKFRSLKNGDTALEKL
jgi:maleylacetoacetate isomerase